MAGHGFDAQSDAVSLKKAIDGTGKCICMDEYPA